MSQAPSVAASTISADVDAGGLDLPSSRPAIVNTSDFGKIEWKQVGFVKAQIDNGIQLLKAKHLFNVTETIRESQPVEISAYCVPQTSVRNDPYRLFFRLDADRNVTTHGCTCSFGSHSCKHKAALGEFINTHRVESKTDQQCGFLKPSNANLKLYPKGESLEKIENIPKNKCCPKLDFAMIGDDEKEYLANLMKSNGLIKSPLYTIVSKRFQPTATVADRELEPWMKDSIFTETKLDDIPYDVRRFFNFN